MGVFIVSGEFDDVDGSMLLLTVVGGCLACFRLLVSAKTQK